MKIYECLWRYPVRCCLASVPMGLITYLVSRLFFGTEALAMHRWDSCIFAGFFICFCFALRIPQGDGPSFKTFCLEMCCGLSGSCCAIGILLTVVIGWRSLYVVGCVCLTVVAFILTIIIAMAVVMKIIDVAIYSWKRIRSIRNHAGPHVLLA